MSRTTDTALTARIVEAARRIWHQRGESALTLRAVARAAGTTTPSVYQRFPAKHDLIEAIAVWAQQGMAARILHSRSLEDAFKEYLSFARRHRHEYALFFGPDFPRLFAPGRPRPGFEWVEKQLARRHGGKPEEYEATVYALQSVLHGAASMLVHVPRGALERQIRESCLRACSVLIANPIRPKGKRSKK